MSPEQVATRLRGIAGEIEAIRYDPNLCHPLPPDFGPGERIALAATLKKTVERLQQIARELTGKAAQ